MPKKVNRLFLDIETSFSVVATFSLWPKHIPHDNILKDWYIICARWKWEGQKKIYSSKTYTRNDKRVVRELSKAISEAHEIVYHNGKKFDYKKLHTRMLIHNIPPIQKPRETDTLIQARKHFSFTSNRLDYIGHVLLDKGKIKNPPNLWLEALNLNREAIDQMDKYCGGDVLLLEAVFQKMKPYIECGFNAALLYDDVVCTSCESHNYIKYGDYFTKTAVYQKYRCKDCLAVFHDGTRIKRLNPAVRK